MLPTALTWSLHVVYTHTHTHAVTNKVKYLKNTLIHREFDKLYKDRLL